jgi:hypothetical protein
MCPIAAPTARGLHRFPGRRTLRAVVGSRGRRGDGSPLDFSAKRPSLTQRHHRSRPDVPAIHGDTK